MQLTNLSADVIIVLLFTAIMISSYFRGGIADIKFLISFVLGIIAVPIFYPAARSILIGAGVISNPTLANAQATLILTIFKLSTFFIWTTIIMVILKLLFPTLATRTASAFDGILGLFTGFIKSVLIVWLINWVLSLSNWRIFIDFSTWLKGSGLYNSLTAINIFDLLQKLH